MREERRIKWRKELCRERRIGASTHTHTHHSFLYDSLLFSLPNRRPPSPGTTPRLGRAHTRREKGREGEKGRRAKGGMTKEKER
jgi:hypothetical protein